MNEPRKDVVYGKKRHKEAIPGKEGDDTLTLLIKMEVFD